MIDNGSWIIDLKKMTGLHTSGTVVEFFDDAIVDIRDFPSGTTAADIQALQRSAYFAYGAIKTPVKRTISSKPKTRNRPILGLKPK